ncbi:unnamed protein product [Sphagnum tenellum]
MLQITDRNNIGVLLLHSQFQDKRNNGKQHLVKQWGLIDRSTSSSLVAAAVVGPASPLGRGEEGMCVLVVMVVVSEDANDAVKKNVVTPVDSVINKTWVVVWWWWWSRPLHH